MDGGTGGRDGLRVHALGIRDNICRLLCSGLAEESILWSHLDSAGVGIVGRDGLRVHALEARSF